MSTPAAPPADEVTVEQLFTVGMGFMSAKMLFVANELGVFPALADEGADVDSLAARLDVPRRTLRMILDAMVAIELLQFEHGTYRNSALSERFLAGVGPVDARPMLRFWDQLSYHAFADLERLVRTDTPPVLHDLDGPRQDVFSEGVAAATASSARGICTAYDFAGHRRVLDVGGGTGSILAAVLGANPHLDATLVDSSEVVAIARESLGQAAVGDRVRLVSANIAVDALPPGHDVVLLSHVVHYFRPDANVALARRIRQAVEPGAKLLILDFWTNDTHTAPLTATLMAAQFLTSMGGDVFSETEMVDWLNQSDWRHLETLQLPGLADSLIVAEAV